MKVIRTCTNITGSSRYRYRLLVRKIDSGKIPANATHRLFQAAQLFFPDLLESEVEKYGCDGNGRSAEITFFRDGDPPINFSNDNSSHKGVASTL
ncbi:hypothetical protein KC851_01120 [Candidatus Kaiserbacteria bacterium]|nr:hypothetical protein [Candidatus Kaiserbacteria bacterium]